MVRPALHIGYRACNHCLTCPLGQVRGLAHLLVLGKERTVTALRLFDSDVAIQIDDFLGIVNLDDVGKTWNPRSLQ